MLGTGEKVQTWVSCGTAFLACINTLFHPTVLLVAHQNDSPNLFLTTFQTHVLQGCPAHTGGSCFISCTLRCWASPEKRQVLFRSDSGEIRRSSRWCGSLVEVLGEILVSEGVQHFSNLFEDEQHFSKGSCLRVVFLYAVRDNHMLVVVQWCDVPAAQDGSCGAHQTKWSELW